MFGSEKLFGELESEGLGDWVDVLRMRSREANEDQAHGKREAWQRAIEAMPVPESVSTSFDLKASIDGTLSTQQRETLRECLMQLHPWRKGPFDLCGIHIDTEWRSDWKWDRLRGHVDFSDANVLDVGCGNGYYGWRMLGAGARRVVGLEPFPIYIAQHEAIHQFAPSAENYVIPGTDADIPERLSFFDIALSMGVLYHRTSPIDHLRSMSHSLRRGGQLVLETLVIDDQDEAVLVPRGRYAQMRNVWFLPSPSLLETFLLRCGFNDVRIVDITATTTREQRQTDWMTFDSLGRFLSEDETTTIEGYPPPTRAIAIATKV